MRKWVSSSPATGSPPRVFTVKKTARLLGLRWADSTTDSFSPEAQPEVDKPHDKASSDASGRARMLVLSSVARPDKTSDSVRRYHRTGSAHPGLHVGAPPDSTAAGIDRTETGMRRRTCLALTVGLALPGLGAPGVASGQVDIRVRLPLPIIRFETPPPLVVVSPGVEVVPDYPEEVFHRDGWYWHRSEDRWYRTRDHRGGWVVVERRHVPVVLLEVPPGKYKRHKAHKAHKSNDGKHDRKGHKHKHKHKH